MCYLINNLANNVAENLIIIFKMYKQENVCTEKQKCKNKI